MADRSLELAAAVYATLAGNAALTAVLGGTGRIHDHVQPGSPLPYVTIGDGQAADYGGSDVDAQEHTLTIDCWSETPSSLELRRIMAAVRAALHDADLTLSAGRCANIRQESSQTLRDPDGITHHGVLRFRAVTTD